MTRAAPGRGDQGPVEVSVVMPVWRPHRAWLEEAVRGVLAERSCRLELVVVDDGNDVPVAELLAHVDDPRVRHVRVPHGGVSAARNAGVDAARGGYVRFVDADDVVAPGSTSRLLALASPTTISYEDTVVCDEHLQPRYTISSSLSGDIAVECLLGRFDSRHVSMLFPVDVVRRAGGWDPGMRVREDFDFVLRCTELAQVRPGSGTATLYRRHGTSATAGATALDEAQRVTRTLVRGFFARHPELRGTLTERAAWRGVHSAQARSALDQDRPWATARRAAPLLRLAPREAVGLWVRAAQRALRLSGAASARTTARARAALRRAGG